MEDRSNKTIICSVLFLDIVEYSKKSVAGQISLKDRFNAYLSEAIHDVPVTDRIILDTGDGAAVNFLGDVESALTAAMRLRESLLGEDPDQEPKLLVRIGINLGPVRLVRDINGQPNIVGDGINVAQRVMAFADASQILVSRSYYDAVSRLSPEYTGMFHYQGSRTDKHVREHEVYAIGYPGDQPGLPAVTAASDVSGQPPEMPVDAGSGLHPAAATAKRGVLYAVLAVLALLGAVFKFMPGKSSQPSEPIVETMQAQSAVIAMPASQPAPAAVASKAAQTAPAAEISSADKTADKSSHQAQAKPKADVAAGKKAAAKPSVPAKSADSHAQSKDTAAAKPASDANEAGSNHETLIAISCKEGAQVFVDGTAKGKLASDAMTVTTKPGKHKVILTHPSFGIFTEEVSIEPGKTGRIRPKVCN